MIVSEASPMTAKMRSKPYRDNSRPDWDGVRVKIMRWCLRAKLLQNWETFSDLLLATGERPIVEDSRKDDYWGAKGGEANLLAGRNVLGRLLMELRELVRNDPARLEELPPLAIPNFKFVDEPIPTLSKSSPRGSESGDCYVTYKQDQFRESKLAEVTVPNRFL